MADKRVDELDDIDALADADSFPVRDASATTELKEVTASQIAAYINAAGAASSAIAAHVAAADPHPTYLTAAEGAAAYQPLDADLTQIAAANNGSVLAATTASFTTADETKLDGLVSNATHTGDVTGATALTIANDAVTNAKLANMAASTFKARVTASTGDPEDATPAQARSLLDPLNTVAATGATETLLIGTNDCTMDQNCTFTFPTVGAGRHEFTLILRGAFTPTFPASVDWPSGTPPTYASPTEFSFATVDSGTTWLGVAAPGFG